MSDLNSKYIEIMRQRAEQDMAALASLQLQKATKIYGYGLRCFDTAFHKGSTSVTFPMWAAFFEKGGNAVFFQDCGDTRAIAQMAINMFTAEGLKASYGPEGITVSLNR
jgi:hypothetical protein